jgi:signal transduction histidine kinase
LPKEGEKVFLFLGTENADITITAGDEELITILTNQIGQALENARLFEKTWRAQQDLEKKVEERTAELKLVLEEVKRISKRKSDFISSVSHELRTPLTSIKGYASILLAGKLGELPKEIHNRLDKINRHSDELAHLVNDLLDISRIESGKVIMKQEPQDLNSLIEKVIDLLSVQLKERGLETYIKQIPADAAVVFVDRNQIERVFINLIGNAIKFTPPKGKITVSAHKADKEVQLDITDTGCGIPEQAKEAIFEEFYRVDNPINEQVKGTGLGLALVKHIIEAHGGRIWVKSKEGAGSTFSFTLPQQT